eukprot:631793-Prymnesium_polylepis.1
MPTAGLWVCRPTTPTTLYGWVSAKSVVQVKGLCREGRAVLQRCNDKRAVRSAAASMAHFRLASRGLIAARLGQSARLISGGGRGSIAARARVRRRPRA